MTVRSTSQTLASRILAAALFECLPGLTILAVEEAFGGFYCDFSFSQLFSSEILVLLEERMRQIIREKREIRRMELVPFSASEWLKRIGQLERASQALAHPDYVHLIQIGSFVDWCENPCGRHTGESGVFRLLDQKKIGKNQFRIFGLAAVSKEELRSQIQLLKKFPERDHELRGIDRGYWNVIDDERIWLAQGLEARRKLVGHWRELFSAAALEVEGSDRYLKQISEGRGNIPVMQFIRLPEETLQERGLLDLSNSLVLQVNSFGDSERDCISFLQIAHKSLTILGFTFRIRLFGKKRKASALEHALQQLGWKVESEGAGDEPRLEFLVKDALQCEWAVATMYELRRKNFLQFTVWIERNLALLLEKDNESEFSVIR